MFFSLNPFFLRFDKCQMVLGLFISLLDEFDPQKFQVSKLMTDTTSFGY